MKLEPLIAILEQLAKEGCDIDQKRGKHHLPLFDERLFYCKARLLEPCVEEAQNTLQSILREQQASSLTTERAEYLTERLVDQIAAIQREISTTQIRRNEPKHHNYTQKPINDLYQNLAQHQEWERRLMEMVQAKEQALSHAAPLHHQAALNELVATELRLKRCKESKLRIEKQITYRERNQ